ncbi:MAG: hypothetical protein ACOYN6_07800 [Ignavibacteria bacterium]
MIIFKGYVSDRKCRRYSVLQKWNVYDILISGIFLIYKYGIPTAFCKRKFLYILFSFGALVVNLLCISLKLFSSDAVFKITITGKAKLKLGFCANANAPVAAGAKFAAGETKTLTAAELGITAENIFLNCTNADAVQGGFKIKLPQE